ncbi:MAG: hypothetical protein NUW37_15790 [Planctomycetes bacterium]|nr:hypothetical protein [Planctomycetota bacterium]
MIGTSTSRAERACAAERAGALKAQRDMIEERRRSEALEIVYAYGINLSSALKVVDEKWSIQRAINEEKKRKHVQY